MQDIAERLRAAVEEVLVVHWIGIVAELQGARRRGQGPGTSVRSHQHGQLAQARVWEAGQRLLRKHKAAAAHIDRETVSERQGLPFALAAEDAGVQRGQGDAVQRRVWRRPAAGRELHPGRGCLGAPQSWGGGTAPGGGRDFPGCGGGCPPPVHPYSLHRCASAPSRLWELGVCGSVARRCWSLEAGRRGVVSQEMLGCGLSSEPYQGTLPVSVASPDFCTPSPTL